MSAPNLLERLPAELRFQVYGHIFQSDKPQDPPFHDLIDHVPGSAPNHDGGSLAQAYPELRQEILEEFRRHCTKLVWHVFAETTWPPPFGETKYLSLNEVHVVICPQFEGLTTNASGLRANLQKCVEFLNENLRYVPVLCVELAGRAIPWDMEMCSRTHDGLEEQGESETMFSYVLAPLRQLRTKVLEVKIELPDGWTWDQRETLDRVRFPLERTLMWEAEREAAQLRRGGRGDIE